MSKLVEELKSEHKMLISVLEKAREMGIASNEGKAGFFQAKNALLAHLKKEDEKLYPVLRKHAAHDAPLQRTLDLFASDMTSISASALQFFDTYSKESSGIEFAKDFGRLFSALSARIRKEEDIIYKKYDELETKT